MSPSQISCYKDLSSYPHLPDFHGKLSPTFSLKDHSNNLNDEGSGVCLNSIDSLMNKSSSFSHLVIKLQLLCCHYSRKSTYSNVFSFSRFKSLSKQYLNVSHQIISLFLCTLSNLANTNLLNLSINNEYLFAHASKVLVTETESLETFPTATAAARSYAALLYLSAQSEKLRQPPGLPRVLRLPRLRATGIMVDLGGSRQPLQWDARQRPTCGALHGELRHRTVKDQRKVPVVPHRRLHRPHRLHAASVLLTWGGERKKESITLVLS